MDSIANIRVIRRMSLWRNHLRSLKQNKAISALPAASEQGMAGRPPGMQKILAFGRRTEYPPRYRSGLACLGPGAGQPGLFRPRVALPMKKLGVRGAAVYARKLRLWPLPLRAGSDHALMAQRLC